MQQLKFYFWGVEMGLIKYLKTKPEISITTLLIILIAFKYVTPTMMLFSTPLLVGSVSPDVPYNKTGIVFDKMAENLAEGFARVTKSTYQIGQSLSDYSLFLRIFYYGLVWTVYIGIVFLIFYLIRISIYFLFKFADKIKK